MSEALLETFIPELGDPKRGKVRDIYTSDDQLLMITSDRISIFDEVLDRPVPDKGRVLTGLSRFWFDQTKDIACNHVLSYPDPNVMVVKRCTPLMVEVIVRGYLAGSMARDYREGKREKCGVALPDGLSEGDPLPHPIVTPTTKAEEGNDEDITADELIARDIVTREQWNQVHASALRLFERGQAVAQSKGLILVDTKYEFGIDNNGSIVLIDEVHTPDSSRYWFSSDYEKRQLRYPDKEFVRQWGLNRTDRSLPAEVAQQASNGYREVYRAITGNELSEEKRSVRSRLLENLKAAQLIRGCFCAILAGSEKDDVHVGHIREELATRGVPCKAIVASAHKHTTRVMELISQYEKSIEPLVFITVAGRSNALSGVVAANSRWPVIACPPFKDKSDYLVNIHSSLQMPSHVPVMTVLEPSNAAEATRRILNTMEAAS